MFLLVVAVPALLVVVLGYVVGYGFWTWIAGMADAALGTSLAREPKRPAGSPVCWRSPARSGAHSAVGEHAAGGTDAVPGGGEPAAGG